MRLLWGCIMDLLWESLDTSSEVGPPEAKNIRLLGFKILQIFHIAYKLGGPIEYAP